MIVRAYIEYMDKFKCYLKIMKNTIHLYNYNNKVSFKIILLF
uniref:Uncharacterized protein n=1 Tax=Manihot esculenta TaxID=3983 RepID=A0A2C9UA36_MANES